MGLFGRQDIGRQERLAAAGRARAKGRYKKAIAEYREALAQQPDDPATHAKLGPLLAKVGDFPGAWGAFVAAGERYFDQGFVEKSLAVYLQAAEAMPWHPKTWKAAARMLLDKGRRADAYKLLLDGRDHLRRRSQRPEAIELLVVAVKLDDSDFEVMIDLARLHRKVDRADDALEVLNTLAQRSKGAQLKRVRREYFALGPSARTAWRWLFGKG
ncbi:MAG TPA: tetratricopeptide repeat protein [Myxococcales bacterium]|jgi:tetratricopeptide (TPR) repeat protein